MKKLNLLVGFMLLAFALQAQTTVPKDQGNEKKKKTNFYFEVFGGANLSNISGNQGSSYSSLVGAQFGVGLTVIDFSKVLGLRTELAFSMQGAKYGSSGSSSYSYSGNTRLNYLNLPIFARYQTPGGFYGELGVQPGLLLSAKDSYSGSSSSGSSDLKDRLNSFDFGIPIGAGYKFKHKFGVGVRVVPGVTNILKKQSGSSTSSSSYTEHNFVATLRASYAF